MIRSSDPQCSSATAVAVLAAAVGVLAMFLRITRTIHAEDLRGWPCRWWKRRHQEEITDSIALLPVFFGLGTLA